MTQLEDLRTATFDVSDVSYLLGLQPSNEAERQQVTHAWAALSQAENLSQSACVAALMHFHQFTGLSIYRPEMLARIASAISVALDDFATCEQIPAHLVETECHVIISDDAGIICFTSNFCAALRLLGNPEHFTCFNLSVILRRLRDYVDARSMGLTTD